MMFSMFEHCLYFNTTSLSRVLEREWTIAFRPFGLTPSQAFMLRVILAKPGLLQRELAEEMNISRPTATRALDGLQKLKLIERCDSKRDGREWEIYPTEIALTFREPLNVASAEVTKRLKKLLGAARFEDTVSKVKDVRTALE